MTTQPPLPRLVPWHKSLSKPLRSRWLIGFLIAGGLAGGGLWVYQTIASSQTTNRSLAMATVQQKSVPMTIWANGTIKPKRTINLSLKTLGYLKQLLVKKSDRIQQGQIVAYMDDSNLQGQLTQTHAQLAQQAANLNLE